MIQVSPKRRRVPPEGRTADMAARIGCCRCRCGKGRPNRTSAGTQIARVVRNIAPLRRASADMSFRIGPRRRAGGFGERAISALSVDPSCTPPTILRILCARSRRRRRDAASSPQPFLEQIVSPMISSSTIVRLPETVAPMEHTYNHARVESSSLLVGSGPDPTDLGGLFRIRNPRSEGSGCRFGTR